MVKMLSTEGCIFLSVAIISIIYFRLLGHMVNLKISLKGCAFWIFSALFNGFIATTVESATGGKSNLAVISFVTLVLVLESFLINREKDYFIGKSDFTNVIYRCTHGNKACYVPGYHVEKLLNPGWLPSYYYISCS